MAENSRINAERISDKSASDPQLPHIYFNGFRNRVSTTDVLIELNINGNPMIVINTTHAMAKALANGLSQLLASFETTTGSAVPNLTELQSTIQKSNKDA
jgi:hypothetical protein